MFLPWLVSTVLATAVEAVIDAWLLSKVQNTGKKNKPVVIHSSPESFMPQTAFLFTLELFFLMLQVFKHQCKHNPLSPSVQVYSVVCTVQLYTHLGIVELQTEESEGQFTKVCI